MSVAVVDYGVGNLFSLECSLRKIGADSFVTADPARILSAARVILPGVGAFGDAIDRLRALNLDRVLVDYAHRGGALLGVCLGMQLLFQESLEYGRHTGLGLLPGRIVPLADALPPGAKTPHMGWNSLDIVQPAEPLLRGLPPGAHAYYVHSYYAVDCAPCVAAYSDYLGVRIPGVVRFRNIAGTQFHPEKSGGAGLGMLRAFTKG